MLDCINQVGSDCLEARISNAADVTSVLVKGGPDTNCIFNPKDGSLDLQAPLNPGGQQSGISNIQWCAGCFCSNDCPVNT